MYDLKTTFKASIRSDLGCIWPSYLAKEEGCSDEPCDYHGEYTDTKCVTNCGNLTKKIGFMTIMLNSLLFIL